jgi:hypothetical protein
MSDQDLDEKKSPAPGLALPQLEVITGVPPMRSIASSEEVIIVERFDFEACLRVRAFQFTRGSALYRELFQFLDEIKAAK